MIIEHYIKRIGKAYFLTFYVNGVKKTAATDRDGLIEIQHNINKCLDAPGNNQNGGWLPSERGYRD